MGLFGILAVLLTLCAFFSYVNLRFLKLPTSIGLMLMSIVSSLALLTLGSRVPAIFAYAKQLGGSIDFRETVLQSMLGVMLFAAALHINLADLRKQRAAIALLASVGVLISTVLVGLLTWGLFSLLGLHARLIYCLLFGALISPTDPIAVLSILKSLNAPQSLETKIAGESLFNDGVGVVVFIALLQVADVGADFAAAHFAGLLLREVVGGALFGLGIGWVALRMLRGIEEYKVEVLITLAVAVGGYAGAALLHVSGPLAMVVAGLFIGNEGRAGALSPKTRSHLDPFWELIDEILNAVVFVLIGLELLTLEMPMELVVVGALTWVVVVAARFIAVALPLSVIHFIGKPFAQGTAKVLAWGGLRGGISLALALSIPEFNGTTPIAERAMILPVTYVVVVLSIVIQGLSIDRVLARSVRAVTSLESASEAR